MICRNYDHGDDEDDKDENSFRLSIPEAKKLIMMTMTIAMVVMKNLMMKKKFFEVVWQFLWSGDTAASVPSFMCLRRCATATR